MNRSEFERLTIDFLYTDLSAGTDLISNPAGEGGQRELDEEMKNNQEEDDPKEDAEDPEEKETSPEVSAENDATTDAKQDPEVTADAADDKDVELEDDPDAEEIIDSSKMYGAANGGSAGSFRPPSAAPPRCGACRCNCSPWRSRGRRCHG